MNDPKEILIHLRTGKFHRASKQRSALVTQYESAVKLLSVDDYDYFKVFINSELTNLINDRESHKISISLLNDIIQCSIRDNDLTIFTSFEKLIFDLTDINKSRHFLYLISLAKLRFKILSDISYIEDFFIKRYLSKNRNGNIHYPYIQEFLINVPEFNKRKILVHLLKMNPVNQAIVERFLNDFSSELKKYTILK